MRSGAAKSAGFTQARTYFCATDAIVAVIKVAIVAALHATVLIGRQSVSCICVCKHLVSMLRQLLLGQRGSADSAGNTVSFRKKIMTGGRYVFGTDTARNAGGKRR